MKNKLPQILSVLLAAILQMAPMLKAFLPIESQGIAPAGWAVILKWATGAVALMGYHAISSASSVAISPANATVGTPYVGTITYAGGHSASVSSMALSNNFTASECLNGTAQPFGDGLTITYSGVNKATVSGTPTSVSNLFFRMLVYDGGTCGSGLSDLRETATLVVGPGSGNIAPTMTAPPQSVVAQIGSDVTLGGAASGTPTPSYFWKIGTTVIPGATNASINFTNIQTVSAGLYTLTATNAAGSASATCWLTVVLTPGSNQLALRYTNYVPVSNATVMTSYLTNAPAGSNVYKYQFNFVDVSAYSTSGSNFNLAANLATASRSGIYSIVFNSVVGANTIVNQLGYDSYWAFGAMPVCTALQGTNVNAGTNVTFSTQATVQQNPYGNSLGLGFYWYKNGTTLVHSSTSAGTNQTATLTLTNVQPSDSGSYTVVVTNFWGSTTSSPAILNVAAVGSPPAITAQPAPKSVLVGQSASFSVTATGTPAPAYQWQKVGLGNLSDGGVFSGTTSNILTLSGVGLANAGNYFVTITNTVGSTNSATAALTVSDPPFVGLTPTAGNSSVLSAATTAGLTYVVQAADNVSTPMTWINVVTNVVPGNGIVNFTNNTSSPQRYFRLVFP